MQVTINGEPQEATLTLKREDGSLDTENLYVNDWQVARVTHSYADDTPVVLAIDEKTIVEIEPQAFYTIEGMHRDWQPGTQEGAIGIS
jgi:hypothetical protein